MATKTTVLHKQSRKSNFEGSAEHAFDIIREEGRKAGQVKIGGIIEQGTALMRVARERQRNEARYKSLFIDIERWVRELLECDLAPLSDDEVWRQFRIWQARIAHAVDLHGDATSQAMSYLAILDAVRD